MVIYQQEFIVDLREECQELIEQHWEEIALNKEKIKLNPDFDSYEALEASNNFKVFTARDNGVLVGYFAVIVGRSLHYKDHIFATNDVIYLSKGHRKGFTGIKLIKFAEKCLRDDGVSLMMVNIKVHKPFDKLMEFLGFKCVERVYSKYIGN